MKGQDKIIKRYQLEHLVPFVLTLLSAYFWVKDFRYDGVYFTGLSVNIIGLIIWWSAKITLAENWDAGYSQPKIKKLVTKGIYSKICHPLYWGINITLIGLCLIHQNLILITVSILIAIYFLRRMKIEDKFLTKKLGNRYTNYRNRTWIKI